MLHQKQEDYRTISFLTRCGLPLLTHVVNNVSLNWRVQQEPEGSLAMDRLEAFTKELQSELSQHTALNDDTTVVVGSPTYRLALEVAGQLDLEFQHPITYGHVRRLVLEAQSELQAAA